MGILRELSLNVCNLRERERERERNAEPIRVHLLCEDTSASTCKTLAQASNQPLPGPKHARHLRRAKEDESHIGN